MFGALVRRAQRTIDSAIGNAVTRALVAVPFVVAIGFLTAAAILRLTEMYGAETAYLILAGGYAFVGLVGLAIANVRSNEVGGAPALDASASEAAAASEEVPEEQPLSGADRELLIAALTSAAPIALPSLLRVLYRNLPVVISLLAAVLLYRSSSDSEVAGDDAAVPAE